MKFEIGGNYSADDEQNKFYIADDDISLMYNTTLPYDYIYSIFLSEDWRYEIIADSDTGRCVQFQCPISCLNAEFLSLTIPKSERKELFFTDSEPLEKGSGCHYVPFSGRAFFDKQTKILCIGDYRAAGEAVEFAPHITAVISAGVLKCVYLELGNIPDICECLNDNKQKEKSEMKPSTKTIIKRAIAYIIDWNLIFIISIAVLISEKNFSVEYLIVPSTDMFSPVNVILGLLCFMALPLIKDLIFRNASLGKLIMGLRVVDAATGKPATVCSLVLRNMTFYLLPVELIAFITSGKTIGDRISGSIVAEKRRQDTES